tara:strand:- start:198 stop:431 length:234 start_codon:yes stop_codon:yes gene_type:complete
MNNIIHIHKSDPIIEQWNTAIDKDAAFKTIAFKFFGGDSSKLDSYLQTFGQIVESIKSENVNSESQEINGYRQLSMF